MFFRVVIFLHLSLLSISTSPLMDGYTTKAIFIAAEVTEQKIRSLVIDLLQFTLDHRSMPFRFLLLEHFTDLMMLSKFMKVRETSTTYTLW